jgi:NADH dehydrogenase FAD-containing subunit
VAAGSERFEKAFFCWAAGSTFAGPEIRGKVSRLADGRLRVLPDLSLPGYPDVFAAGDAAAFEKRGEFLRKSVHFAWCQGQCAGRNLARRAAGRATRPFRPLDAGWIIPLHAESTGRLFGKIRTGGVTGLRLHYLMCGLRNSGAANIAGFARMALTLFNEEKS